ncbi:MAG: hypothetical protein JSW61_00450 [Candidatus Thorarchaeota archaeon]|nr:MAG: hypothetical protein JSW61_00450 [Candidatus Thorarchaeota archaeon]
MTEDKTYPRTHEDSFSVDDVPRTDALDSIPQRDGATPDAVYDISDILDKTGHRTHVYSNGITLGVRTSGIPSARGVHLEIVYVLDLREATFGKASIAMKAAVLETVNRSLPSVLKDVDLDDRWDELSVMTPWGQIPLQTLKSSDGGNRSLLHITRAVYVVSKDVRPTIDLSWLTEARRVLDIEGFSLARRSDARSILPDVSESVDSEKWRLLERGVKKGWYGALLLGLPIIGTLAFVSAFVSGSGNLLLPLAATILGAASSSLYLTQSRRVIQEFKQQLALERNALDEIGEAQRIDKSVFENARTLKIINDLGFVVSPLIGSAARAARDGSTERSVLLCSSILDECVRVSSNLIPKEMETRHTLSSDPGMERFLDLFRFLEGLEDESEEAELALAYAAITNHMVSPVSAEQLVEFIGYLNLSLFNAGIVPRDTRDSVDELILRKSTERLLAYFDEELSRPEDQIQSFETLEDDSLKEHHELMNELRSSGRDDTSRTLQEEGSHIEDNTGYGKMVFESEEEFDAA